MDDKGLLIDALVNDDGNDRLRSPKLCVLVIESFDI
jgi:hypothetical protein